MSRTKNLLSVFTGLAIGATCITAGEALAVSITATANDDGTNTTIFGTQLQDGDFSITANSGNPATTTLGDGLNETIRWNFDFNADSNLTAFNSAIGSGATLSKAELTFSLRPVSGLITTDSTGIPSVQGINIPSLPGVTSSVGQDITFTFDLFDYGFDSNNILTAFNSGTLNSIPWFWQDDVKMYSASLTLETDTPTASTPEPGTILGLLVLGAFGVKTIKPRFRSQRG
jgi:hypothetical protein